MYDPDNGEESPLSRKAQQTAEFLAERKEEYEVKKKCGEFGICWNCRRFNYRVTKYGKEEASCNQYDRPDRVLSSADPVVECTDHSNRFAMSLEAMWAIATIIDADGPRQAGFITKEKL